MSKHAAERSEPHPMLTQAVANLQALEAELREASALPLEERWSDNDWTRTVQCWVDKLGTVIEDLKNDNPSFDATN